MGVKADMGAPGKRGDKQPPRPWRARGMLGRRLREFEARLNNLKVGRGKSRLDQGKFSYGIDLAGKCLLLSQCFLTEDGSCRPCALSITGMEVLGRI